MVSEVSLPARQAPRLQAANGLSLALWSSGEFRGNGCCRKGKPDPWTRKACLAVLLPGGAGDQTGGRKVSALSYSLSSVFQGGGSYLPPAARGVSCSQPSLAWRA